GKARAPRHRRRRRALMLSRPARVRPVPLVVGPRGVPLRRRRPPVAVRPAVRLVVARPRPARPLGRSVWRPVRHWKQVSGPARPPPGRLRAPVNGQLVKVRGAVQVAAVEASRGPRTYGNWRRPTSPGILGLGSIGTALLLAGLILVVIVVMIAGLLEAVIVAGVLGVVLLAVLTKDAHGKNIISRAGARAGWWTARSRGTHIYRSGPLGRALWGTYQLPGLAAPTRLSEFTDSYGRPFALLHTPATGNYSIVIGTEPDGAALVDQEQIDTWVANWGHWLANLGDEPGVEAASVTIETAPDSGTRLRREVQMNIDEDAPAFAREMLREVVDHYPAGSSTVTAYVAITFSAAQRLGGRKRPPEEMGRELAARLPGLTAGLQATGAGAARPLSAQELCEVIRIAYDPAAAVLIDEARAA